MISKGAPLVYMLDKVTHSYTKMKGKSEIQMLLLKSTVAVPADLPGIKGLYQPVKVDSKAIWPFTIS